MEEFAVSAAALSAETVAKPQTGGSPQTEELPAASGSSWWNQLRETASAAATSAASAAAVYAAELSDQATPALRGVARQVAEKASEAGELARPFAQSVSQRASELSSIALEKATRLAEELAKPETRTELANSLSRVVRLAGLAGDDISDDLRQFLAAVSADVFEEAATTLPAGAPPPLSVWQASHARTVLSRVPAAAELHALLVPARLAEDRFWATYFRLCAGVLGSEPEESHTVMPNVATVPPAVQAAPSSVAFAVATVPLASAVPLDAEDEAPKEGDPEEELLKADDGAGADAGDLEAEFASLLE